MQQTNIKNDIFPILIGLYPVALTLGTMVSETINFILIANFLIKSYSSRNWAWIKSKIFIFLLIIWFYLLINSIFSTFPYESFSRSLGFIRFPILIFSIIFIFNKKNSEKIIFNLWFVTLSFLMIDLLFQSVFGYNLVGYKSPWPERLSGMMFKELKIAHLLIGFTLPVLFYKFKNDKKTFKFIFYVLFFLIIVMLTGERANTIRCILIIFFSFVFYKTLLKKKSKLNLLAFLIIIIASLLYLKPNIHQRYIIEISHAYKSNNFSISKLIEKSNYGPHFLSAIEIFKKYPVLGSGTRTFRIVCSKDEFSLHKYGFLNGCSTHPHQFFFELLSELGLLGFFLIIGFIFYTLCLAKNHLKKTSNEAIIAPSIFILVMSLPLLPGGSFFNSFGATVFWINISLIFKNLNA